MHTILILSAGTGSGHDSVAEAIAQEVAASPNLRPCIAAPLGGAINGCYGWALNRAPRLWGACYHATDSWAMAAVSTRLLAATRGARLAALIAAERPSLIVSVHALCAQLAARVLSASRSPIPHHCVVTDLVDLHHTWVAPGVSGYYVATDQAHAALVSAGVRDGTILITGLPIRRSFVTPGYRDHEGPDGAAPWLEVADRSRPRVLVLDGGQPGPALSRAVTVLLGAGVPLDITVGWGRLSPPQAPPTIGPAGGSIRHVPPGADIAARMREADLLVTKAGSVTIAEALAVGCPLLIHRVAPGQEAGNPRLVQTGGAGLLTPTPEALVGAVRRLAQAPRERLAMARRAAALGRPEAARAVAASLGAAIQGKAGQSAFPVAAGQR